MNWRSGPIGMMRHDELLNALLANSGLSPDQKRGETMNSENEREAQALISTGGTTVEPPMVTLQPLAMHLFDPDGVYYPSKLRPKVKISYELFLERYADHPIIINVSTDEDIFEHERVPHSRAMTAYGFGFDGWYIVVD